MPIPDQTVRYALELYEMATRFVALGGIVPGSALAADWLEQESARSQPSAERQCLRVLAKVLRQAELSSSGPQIPAIVICRADRQPNGLPGPYQLATRRVFDLHEAEQYAAGIAASREPIVVEGAFHELRLAPEKVEA